MLLIFFFYSHIRYETIRIGMGIVLLIFCIAPLRCLFPLQQQFTIMFDPTRDTQNVGRSIKDTYERNLTLQWVEAIKCDVEIKCPEIMVVLTRLSGETMQPLQNANFANQFNIDLYLNLQLYKKFDHKARLIFFTFLYVADYIGVWPHSEQLTFLPIHRAYKKSALQSARYASTF